MLDDNNIIKQRDPNEALKVASDEYQQVMFDAIINNKEHDNRLISRVVIAGMGGSALSALMIHRWLKDQIKVPIEVIRDYNLPAYVDKSSLVIASSYSGNTEETVSCLKDAQSKKAEISIISAGGELEKIAAATKACYVKLPTGYQPRMAVIFSLRAICALLANFGLIDYDVYNSVSLTADWLKEETKNWLFETPTEQNYAKQLAILTVGKTPVFYGGSLTAPLAYKWKISWNETAKNLAFWNQYPEFNHNEFMGWTGLPIEKPFIIFDLLSNLENPQIIKRFSLSDKLLSGQRPKANQINIKGNTVIEQMLWANILADFASIYTAILNNINPVPVNLIEKLKKEL